MERTKRLFSKGSIAIATFFGGPMAAGYLIKKHYQAHQQEKTGRQAFLISILVTVLLITALILMPESIISKFPNAILPVFISGIIYLFVDKYQGSWLQHHKIEGGEFYSGWKATGIGLIFMLVILLIIGGAGFIAGDLSRPDFDTKKYDEEIAKFTENENKALAVFEVLETSTADYAIKELDKAIVLWRMNKEIITDVNNIENLPEELIQQNKKLIHYCDLRIKYNELIQKAFAEQTDDYLPEIKTVTAEIEKQMSEL
jgi:hypothetical protein